MSVTNIATWNICLGLSNKKDIVADYLKANDVSVCCLQETKIPMNFPENLLNCGGYTVYTRVQVDSSISQIEILKSLFGPKFETLV